MPKKSILVIEDEAPLRELLQYNLEKEGYSVLPADTGEKGVELARAEKPDLVILDLMLPKIDGLEVCRLLKGARETRSIPILMLTAKSSELDQVVGLEVGASDYLAKPFSVKILLARLKNVLRSHEVIGRENVKIQKGDFLLDRDAVRFFIKNKPVELTKTEFGILSVLMDRAEAMVSREQLVSLVWGQGSFVSQASINMQIKSLRDKLGKARYAIETVRGLGYRFVPDPRL